LKNTSLFFLNELNPAQRKAVETTEGPVLVLAGAGSGKTRVLTFRIAYLVKEKKVPPWEILAMTFTNKAAGEMRERVESLIGVNAGLWVGTFHSIFSKILRWESELFNYSPDFVIYDTEDQERLVKSIMNDMGVSIQQYPPKMILSFISRAKNNLISPETYSSSAKTVIEDIVSRVYPEYQNRLRSNHAFDFDDLITIPIHLFDKYPDVLKKYQSRFRYVLVDEYQDTNRAQYMLIRYLAKEHRNICVVGDDDQSIYRWRGADIRNILEFEKDFPGAQVFRLEQNYRSTQNILTAAASIVEKNKGRKEKKLWSNKEPGEKLDLLEAVDERHEAEMVVEKIREKVFKKKHTFRDFAILYRTNAQSRVLEDSLRGRRIPYVIVGSVKFYERKEIKDLLAYLKLITNPKDDLSLKRIINFPLRGIGVTTFSRIEKWAREKSLNLFDAIEKIEEIPEIPVRSRRAIDQFYKLISKYIDLKNKISLNELVHTLVDETKLLNIYKEDNSIESRRRADNIREFLAAVNEYASRNKEATLSGFLEEVSLITDVDTWDDKKNAVTLMTLHSAKGLEFPVVFITGLEEGLFPGYRSLESPDALEEERRLFYVGLTRAREKVYLSWSHRRSFFNGENSRFPSRFLEELDSNVVKITVFSPRKATGQFRGIIQHTPEEDSFSPHPSYESFSQEEPILAPGLWVMHQKYGKGRIVNVEGRGIKQKVTVEFEEGTQKKFIAQYAKFTILGENID